MKEVNLISITKAYLNLTDDGLTRYLKYYEIKIKKEELNDLDLFVRNIEANEMEDYIFNNFYLGYEIPQISKQFDLLRFGDECLLNIEIKKVANEEKIKAQLVQNKYYLDFLGQDVVNYCFVADNQELWKLVGNENLIKTDFADLIHSLANQKPKKVENLDRLFKPSNYLVSPFNSTDKFMDGRYFLTDHQQALKRNAINEMSIDGASFIAISGKAGTGKSLLAYDIAKDFMETEKGDVLTVHCGYLNSGHNELIQKYNWDIIGIRELYNKDISNYKLVVVDETQRIYINQLNHIIDKVKSNGINCIFSHDKEQCLRAKEIINDVPNHIVKNTNPLKLTLTEKIRTNKEIAEFIKCLLDSNRIVDGLPKLNITLSYFKTYQEAIDFISKLNGENWKSINYTPSLAQKLPYDNYHIDVYENAHTVIGQEFEKVVAVVDSYFRYDENGQLSANYWKSYYHPTKMLFQILTRARRKLNFVIIDNEEVLNRCLKILNC